MTVDPVAHQEAGCAHLRVVTRGRRECALCGMQFGLSPEPAGRKMEFTFPLSGDAVATLTVSRGIDADDVATLGEFFDSAKRALLKATEAKP